MRAVLLYVHLPRKGLIAQWFACLGSPWIWIGSGLEAYPIFIRIRLGHPQLTAPQFLSDFSGKSQFPPGDLDVHFGVLVVYEPCVVSNLSAMHAVEPSKRLKGDEGFRTTERRTTIYLRVRYATFDRNAALVLASMYVPLIYGINWSVTHALIESLIFDRSRSIIAPNFWSWSRNQIGLALANGFLNKAMLTDEGRQKMGGESDYLSTGTVICSWSFGRRVVLWGSISRHFETGQYSFDNRPTDS